MEPIVRSGLHPSRQARLRVQLFFGLIGKFRRQLRSYVRNHLTDLIHAHGWVTFDAAGAAAVSEMHLELRVPFYRS